MDTLSGSVAILQLCQILTALCCKSRAIYRGAQGDPTPFYNVMMDLEVQLERLHVCQDEMDRKRLPARPDDIVSRLQHDIEDNLRKINEVLSQYDSEFSLATLNPSTSSADAARHEQTRIQGRLADQTSNVPLRRRFQYVVRDEESVQAYTAIIEKRVSQLREFVLPQMKDILDLRLQAHLLDNKTNEDLQRVARSAQEYHYWTIHFSAGLKVRIRNSAAQRAPSDNEAIRCDPQKFTASQAWEGRTIGQYGDEKVMVEWKLLSQQLSPEEMKKRVFSIAALLHETNEHIPKDLILLKCVGVMPASANDGGWNFGIVYSIPSNREPTTLYEILPAARLTRGPALERRRNLACVLTKAVFQLHVVGWLHKGIRPHNVAFFGEPKALESPFLIGFDYARKSDVRETSERPNPEFDLYRHPDKRDPQQRFNHSFDLFALGLILLEIGLWQRLDGRVEEYNKHYSTPAKARLQLQERLIASGDVVKDLPFHMGSSYCEAVTTCLGIAEQNLGWEVYTDIIGKLEARE